jgi:DNA-directed RNA polymerase specialized sigma24 family protein
MGWGIRTEFHHLRKEAKVSSRLRSVTQESVAVRLRAKGMPYREIAGLMAVPAETTRWWVKRAEKRVKALLDERQRGEGDCRG